MLANLMQSSWLCRTWDVSTPERTFVIQCYGRGIGYEAVSVDGSIVVLARSWGLSWITPRVEFSLEQTPCFLEIRIWPWLSVRSLRLAIGGHVCYEERQPLFR